MYLGLHGWELVVFWKPMFNLKMDTRTLARGSLLLEGIKCVVVIGHQGLIKLIKCRVSRRHGPFGDFQGLPATVGNERLNP